MNDRVGLTDNEKNSADQVRAGWERQLQERIRPFIQFSSPYYLSAKEVAARYRITLPTLRAWTKNGLVKAHRIRRRILYKPAEIHAVLKEIKTTR